MENSSSFGPLSVASACFKETISFFEKEMVFNELLLLFWSHFPERIVLSFKFPSEGTACSNNLRLNFVPLVFGKFRSKREICKIAANTDSCTCYHFSVFFGEGRALKLSKVHVTGVNVPFLMPMVLQDDRIKQIREGAIRVMATSVNTDSRVHVLTSRKYCFFEGVVMCILRIFVLFPNFSCQILGKERLDFRSKNWESSELFWLLKMWSSLNISSINFTFFWSATAKFFLSRNHGFDTIIHVLNELNFRESKSSLIGDVVDVVISFCMFSVCASYLDIELVCNCLEFGFFTTKLWQMNMN